MEMLFAVLGGALLAIPVRFALPGRDTYGTAVLGAVGAATSAVVWAALTLLGWPFDGGWIWVVSILVAPIAAAAVALILPRRRQPADEAMLQRLSRS